MADEGEVNSATRLDRTVQLTIQDFRPGAAGPTTVQLGTTPTVEALRFDAVGEKATLYVPAAVEKANIPEAGAVVIGLAIELVNAQINGDVLGITADYCIPKFGVSAAGVTKASTQLTPSLTVTTARGLAAGTPYLFTFSLDVADATNPIDSIDVAGLAMEIHLTNVVGVAAFYLLGGCITIETQY